MADADVGPWPIEDVPDADDLFLRVHRRWFDGDGDLDLGCFQNHPKKTGGMSTDWSRYATPGETRRRAIRSTPEDNAVLGLNVAAVRAIPDQSVVHSPISGHPDIPDNRAHCDIFGRKNLETRVFYRRIYRLVIPLDAADAEDAATTSGRSGHG